MSPPGYPCVYTKNISPFGPAVTKNLPKIVSKTINSATIASYYINSAKIDFSHSPKSLYMNP